MRIVLFGALALALAAGAALAAHTSGHRRHSGVVNACVQRKTGRVRVVAGPNACRRGEQALAWNIQGPAGPPGPTGAAGVDGPPGPAGAPGATGAAGPGTVPSGTMLAPGGFYLFGGRDYAGPPAADQTFTASLAATGGGLALRDANGSIVDSLGYGDATNAFVRGHPAPAPPAAPS